MKIALLAVVAVLSVVTVTANSEWTGAVKKIIDAVPLSSKDVKRMTGNIFKEVPRNCDVSFEPHVQAPLPTDNCDVDEYSELEKGYGYETSFDVNAFLDRFFESKVGKRFVLRWKRRGVVESDLKEAMKQTWSSKQSSEDSSSALTRTIFNAGHSTFRSNSWYTYVRYQSSCTRLNHKYVAKDEAFIVKESCEGLDFSSSFVIPNHPFEDLIIYTLCAWRSDTEDCLVSVPKAEGIKVVVSYGNENESRYLISANVET